MSKQKLPTIYVVYKRNVIYMYIYITYMSGVPYIIHPLNSGDRWL